MNSFDNRTKLVIFTLLGAVIVCIMLARRTEGAGLVLASTSVLESSDAGLSDAPEYPYSNHSDEELAAMSREDPVARNELLRRRIEESRRIALPHDSPDGGVVYRVRIEHR